MPLTPELLERLERSWADQRVPLARSLRPGLSDAQLDEILAPFGHTIPTELRLWWGWHNGAEETAWIAVNLAMMRAETAVRDYMMMREIAQQVAIERSVDADSFWPHAWLPILRTSSAPTYASACSTRELRASAAIYYHDSESSAASGYIAAASLGDVVHQLCEAYDAGLQRWDHSRGDWTALEHGRRRPFAF